MNNQLVGNIGLFYVCYELSKRGWNCLPTTRNAKGVDIVIYSLKGDKKYTIQVKSLSKISPVPFGSKLEIMWDFLIKGNILRLIPLAIKLKLKRKREKIKNRSIENPFITTIFSSLFLIS